VVQALLEELDEPLLNSTLILPGDEFPLNDPEEIRDRLEHQVELVLDGGFCSLEMTTVIDLTGDEPELVRSGRGSLVPLGMVYG
jgi:tRNA A37 threonylcarbamoyladenosine synthetase subunit TsaC/SUA5/YrdC